MPNSTTTGYAPEPGDTEAEIIVALSAEIERLRAWITAIGDLSDADGVRGWMARRALAGKAINSAT